MNLMDLQGGVVAFAASGGLDSCTITHWLSQKGVRVVCFTADLGQPDESSFEEIEVRMRACGADDFVRLPAEDLIAAIGLEVIQAQATYEGRYWNTTGAGRQAILKTLVPAMRERGLDILSHGATGRGNDQVRFQVGALMHAPEMKFYVPWRDPAFLDRFGGREEMIKYCEQYGLPIKARRDTPYSTDASLLGLTHEGGKLEGLETDPRIVTPGMGVWPEDAPSKAELVPIEFQSGVPVAIGDLRGELIEILREANRVAGRHGVGVGQHVVENRVVGVKSRGVYEAPGMELLGTAYAYLLQLLLDRRARTVFDFASPAIAWNLYSGFWDDLSTRMLRDAIRCVASLVSGKVTLRLCRGVASYHSCEGVSAGLYTMDSSMEKEGSFDHRDSEGMLNVLSLHARAIARAGQVQ